MKLWLPPYLSLREVNDGIRIGTLPPTAWHLPEPPGFMAELLQRLATPTEREALVRAVATMSGWTRAESETLIDDLEEARVLVPAPETRGRYDRHGLFYQLMGVDSGAQERLASVTIGLIGMGGIGTHLATHLAAAGVGGLVLTDGDSVELSNLTRQTLFRESDIGRLKVEVAAERLQGLRADLRIETVAESFTGPHLAKRVAEHADLVLLSADRPADVHRWTHEACSAAGIPFSASGYIEGHGSVGPLLNPPKTSCFACIQMQAESLPEQGSSEKVSAGTTDGAARELNPSWQAPSFGPLNALVAAAQANDAIRWLIGLQAGTFGRRMLIDSRTYEVSWEEFKATDPACSTCGSSWEDGIWDQIAAQYKEERDEHSFNAVLLDPLIPYLTGAQRSQSIADVGAGAGQVTERLLALGANVDAYEPSESMRRLLTDRVRGHGDRARVVGGGLSDLAGKTRFYDAICCLNVLDHIPDLDGSLETLVSALRPGGRLILSIPHPMKDRGGWAKTPREGGWHYRHYVIDDYFTEGICEKDREDRSGNVRIRGVQTYHRTISRYLQAILDQGMHIRRVLEPEPDISTFDDDSVIYEKSSRIPYFLVIIAERVRYA